MNGKATKPTRNAKKRQKGMSTKGAGEYQGLSWAEPGGPAWGWVGPARPGPTHQFFTWWTAARPGPINFQRIGRDPARSITFSFFPGAARRGPARSKTLTARPMKLAGPRAGPCIVPYYKVTHISPPCFFSVFFHVFVFCSFGSHRPAAFGPRIATHEAHIPSTHTIFLHQRPSPMDSALTGGPPPQRQQATAAAAAAAPAASAPAAATLAPATTPAAIDVSADGVHRSPRQRPFGEGFPDCSTSYHYRFDNGTHEGECR